MEPEKSQILKKHSENKELELDYWKIGDIFPVSLNSLPLFYLYIYKNTHGRLSH